MPSQKRVLTNPDSSRKSLKGKWMTGRRMGLLFIFMHARHMLHRRDHHLAAGFFQSASLLMTLCNGSRPNMSNQERRRR